MFENAKGSSRVPELPRGQPYHGVRGVHVSLREDLMARPVLARDTALNVQNEVVIKSVKEALNVFDFDAVARTKLSTAHYTFITDGSFNNETVRANRKGFSKYEIRLRR